MLRHMWTAAKFVTALGLGFGGGLSVSNGVLLVGHSDAAVIIAAGAGLVASLSLSLLWMDNFGLLGDWV